MEPKSSTRTKERPLLVGVTGASGAIYARRLLEHLRVLSIPTELVITDPGRQVVAWENQNSVYSLVETVHAIGNYFAPPASGSAYYRGMVVVPCSAGTLGRIAAGTGDNLLVRAADVCLKERRPLVLALREMPLSSIHIANMESVVRAGASLVPASPHFYHHPRTLEDLADTVVAKLLDQLGIAHDLFPQWGRTPGESATV